MRCLLFILFFTSITCSAQVFRTGLIVGLSAAQIEGDGYGGYNKIGFIGGGFVNTDLSDKVTTQLEIYFINKGSFDPLRPDKNDYDSFKANLNYIEFPLLIRYHQNKFVFEIGPYIAKLLGTPTLSNENGVLFVDEFPFKPFDFGGFIGIQYQLNDRFGINFRSKNSLIPIRDFPNFDPGGIFGNIFKNGWYNVDLNFTARYEFGK